MRVLEIKAATAVAAVAEEEREEREREGGTNESGIILLSTKDGKRQHQKTSRILAPPTCKTYEVSGVAFRSSLEFT